MRTKRWFIISIIFISVLILCFLSLKPAIKNLSSYLSKNEPVNANILLVEGWLSDKALELAFNEFQKKNYELIITTGLKSTDDYFLMSMNGYLIFYSGNKTNSNDIGNHKIEVKAFSAHEGENSAHFNLFVNNKLIADFSADKLKRGYSVSWYGSLSLIDSIMVQFDNDKVGEFGDRNLLVKEIIIDNKIIIPFLNNTEYHITNPDGIRRIINRYNSNAQNARNQLISLGLDSSEVIAIPGTKARINRTLISAIAVRDWLKESTVNVKGINIVSAGTHSRRTWMTFNKILGEAYNVGIISLQDRTDNRTDKSKFFEIIRETVAIIYYGIILLPY